MLDSTIQRQTTQTQTSNFDKASQFAWALAKDQVDLGRACLTSTIKAVVIAVASIKASSAVARIPTVIPTIEISGKRINIDFSIHRYMPEAATQICRIIFIKPLYKFTEICEGCFSYKNGDLLISDTIYYALGEEILFREIIQNQILPRFARILPERAGKFFIHPITRVAVSSILFATAHLSFWKEKYGVMPQFVAGLTYGIVREVSGGVFLPIYAHAIKNLLIINAASKR